MESNSGTISSFIEANADVMDSRSGRGASRRISQYDATTSCAPWTPVAWKVGPTGVDDVIDGMSAPITTPTIVVGQSGRGPDGTVTFTAEGADADVDFRWLARADGGRYAPEGANSPRLSLPLAFAADEICVRLHLSRDGDGAGPFEKCWQPE